MLISARQIENASLNLAIQQATSGAAFSGNLVSYLAASGWVGDTCVKTTGGFQTITGTKQFLDPVLVRYSGGTGGAPSAQWVSDQILSYSGSAGSSYVQSGNLISASGQLAQNIYTTGSGLYTLIVNGSGQASTDYATKTQLFNTGAALSKVRVTGGGGIQDANLSGIGGVEIIHSGGFILISGGAGGGGASVSVTGSSAISSPNFTGIGSVTLTYDGTYVRVSGAAGADATLSGYVEGNFVNRSTDQSITGIKTFVSSPIVPTATATGQAINLRQLSGYSGYAESAFVHLTGAETISGNKVFATTPLILTGATNGLESVNLSQLSGTSGVLASLNLNASGVLYSQMTGASGVLASAGGATTNTYYITGTGSIVITSNSTGAPIYNTVNLASGNITTATNAISGNVTNTYTISGNPTINCQTSGNVTYNITGTAIISGGTLQQTGNFYTGNFVNISYWFDQYSLGTGLNIIETFVSRDFLFTGYALGAINSGTQGFFSGSFYQRNAANSKTNFVNFSLNSGQLFTGVGGYNQTVSGLNRVGLDIFRIGTGITGLSVGLFGVGT